MKKRNLLFIVFTVVAIICISAITVFATTSDSAPALSIARNTLELKNAVFMNFKVSSENIDDTSAIKLLVWEEPPTEYTKDTAVSTLSSIRTESDTGYIVFQYDDLAAKDMTKIIYACAYAEIDGEEIYSKPVKFSIYQYAYNALNSASYPENLKNLLSGMLQYGAYAQTYFNHNTEFLATDEVAKIKVVNGKHADGFTTGYYKAGTSVIITSNTANDGYAFSHWEDSKGNVVGTESTLIIDECISETYTAKYRDATSAVQYRYREKQYTTSTTELGSPWILYDQHTEIEYGSTIKVYLEKDEAIDTDEYCVHYKTPVCKYMHPTNSTYKWVNSSSTDHYYYHTVGDWQYWHYGDYYCYTCCSVDSKTSVTEYYYYSWGEWSEWSDTPIIATEDREVEVRGVFIVTYDANGGVNAPNAQTKPVSEDIVISSSIPTREGHIFKGWSTTSNGAVEYRAEDVYSTDSNITLYAVWEAYTYTITYNANGGENAPDAQTKTYGVDIVLSTTAPTREGYNFVGWATSENGEVIYNSGNTYSDNCTITLYAVWIIEEKTTYTIVYDANGGTGVPDPVTKEKGKSTYISSVIPTREGFTFLGWSTHQAGNMYSTVDNGIDVVSNWKESDGGIGSYTVADTYGGNKDITLYAVWRINDSSDLLNKCGDDLYWSYDSTTYTLTITGFGAMYNFVKAPWSSYASVIKTVVLPEGFLSIGNNAFAYSCVRNFTIPSTVVSIGSGAFLGDSGLNSLHIPTTVQQICFGAFSNCNYLIDVTIECDGLIDIDTFYGCDRLKNIYILGNVTRILSRAFADCNVGSVLYFELPQSLTWITVNSIRNTSGTYIYYHGTKSQWSILTGTKLSSATVYYYSESEPTTAGNYWYYDENKKPVIW